MISYPSLALTRSLSTRTGRSIKECWNFNGFLKCSLHFCLSWILSRYSSHPFEHGRKLLTIHVTKWALNSIGIKPAPPNDRAYGDRFRVALLELSTPANLTMETYDTELNEDLAYNQELLDIWL